MMNNVSLDTPRREFKNCIETNENEDTIYPSLWVRMKAILRGQFITTHSYIRKTKVILNKQFYDSPDSLVKTKTK